jgi:mycofactocin system glycosyltransferase
MANGETVLNAEARYRLQPGLTLLAGKTGGFLVSVRPLLVVRLNSQALTLLTGLEGEPTATEMAQRLPGMSAAEIATFLETLARRRLLSRKPPPAARLPTVSIIVPAHGRPNATRACIESLLALDYPPERCEIIVVDDASKPPLAPLLADFPVHLLRQPHNIGQSAVRNLAAEKASGELLAFIDNDCIAAPNWLTALLPYLDTPALGIVGGRVIAPPPTGRIAAFEAVRSPLDMGPVGGEVGPRESIAYLPTCNLLVRRDLLLAQGGFNTAMRLGEDVDFLWRSLRSGSRAYYVPEGQIIHYHRVQLRQLLKRRADYGSSEAELQRRHPEGRRIMRVPLVVTLLLVACAAFPLSGLVGAPLMGLVVVLLMRELTEKYQQLRQGGISVPLRWLGGALLREHMASLYHLSATITRYYSLPLLMAVWFWPSLLLPTVILLLIAPLGEYRRRQPGLAFGFFIGLYWLEMAAYQYGVWRGCFSTRSFWPLLPLLRWDR